MVLQVSLYRLLLQMFKEPAVHQSPHPSIVPQKIAAMNHLGLVGLLIANVMEETQFQELLLNMDLALSRQALRNVRNASRRVIQLSRLMLQLLRSIKVKVRVLMSYQKQQPNLNTNHL